MPRDVFGNEYGLPAQPGGEFQQPYPIVTGRVMTLPSVKSQLDVFYVPVFPMGAATFDLSIQIIAPGRTDPDRTIPAFKDADAAWVWFQYQYFRIEWSVGNIGLGQAFAEIDFSGGGIALPITCSSLKVIAINDADPIDPSSPAEFQVACMLGYSRGARLTAIPRRTIPYGALPIGDDVTRAVPRCATRATVKLSNYPGPDRVWAEEYDFGGNLVGGFPVWPVPSTYPIGLSNACQYIRLRNGAGNVATEAAITYDLSL